jgi:hypothetical protein
VNAVETELKRSFEIDYCDKSETIWTSSIFNNLADNDTIECGKCLQWIHYYCENLSAEDYKVHTENENMDLDSNLDTSLFEFEFLFVSGSCLISFSVVHFNSVSSSLISFL